jgi:hypothetical protein
MQGPGSRTERVQTAASMAKGRTTPLVKGMWEGRIAALVAWTAVYSAKAPSAGRPVAKAVECLSKYVRLIDL